MIDEYQEKWLITEKEAKDSLEIATTVKQFIFQKLNIKDSDIKTVI